MIVCDSAKLSLVEDLQFGGLLAISANKGAGSRERMVRQMQSFRIVYTSTSKDLDNEYYDYSYKLDRYDLVTDDIEDRNNDHLIDATKYIIDYLIRYLGIIFN
jgi:phage terminase large subunit